MIQTDKIEKIPPEHWQNTQLSVARFYGGIKIHGVMYHIDENDWLVRDDIIKKEASEASKERKEKIKKSWEDQFNLFKEENK